MQIAGSYISLGDLSLESITFSKEVDAKYIPA